MRNVNLTRVVEDLGYEQVRTVISSGNVLFEAPRRSTATLEARLEAAWPEQLGFSSTTIVRTRAEIHAVVAGRPFGDRTDAPPTSLQVTFLKHEPEPGVDVPRTSERGDDEIVAIRDRAVYSVIDETGRPPGLLRMLERTLGKAMTTRSWKTVHRIARAMDIS
jgi:uncharacterized protein (DUF1697 family)